MTAARTTAGTTMAHPVVVLALATLIVNDHIMKATYPGWVTGKLSDVAGLVLFPVVVVSVIEVVTGAARGSLRRTFLGVAAVTAVAFAAVQLTDLGGELYRQTWGVLQVWTPPGATVALTPDATDLLALPVLGAAAWVYGLGRPPESVTPSP